MKRLTLFLMAMCFSLHVVAANFVMINVENQQHLKQLFDSQHLVIHYYNDDFILATTDFVTDDMIVLDEDSFSSNEVYYIVHCAENNQQRYIERERNNADVLFCNDDILIMKPLNENLKPAKNDGMVSVRNRRAKMPDATRSLPYITEEDTHVRSFMEQVNIGNLESVVEYLQSLQNRMYNSSGAYIASEWILEQFDNMGVLKTEMSPFEVYGNQSSPNIIAIQYGTKYPDEYVVCGGHYDSYSETVLSPGADDNATGVAAVLETARILSQYEFERSIIYCAFSAEEIGLYGSEEYASYCSDVMGLDIVGYFNNDMNGYLYPGDDIHIDLIYPNSAESLGSYYMNIASVYYPDMKVIRKNLVGADSDHTSFNNNGYMGIFPFEDVDHYSPYIHTSDDIIGLSVNSFEMSERFTEMNIASIAHIARYDGGDNVAEQGSKSISVYPNPVKDILTITSDSDNLNEVQIMNTLGQVVEEFTFERQSDVKVESLKPGVYIVNVTNGGRVVTEKLVVR